MRTLQGTITSTRMQRTVVVRIDFLRKHTKYHKFYRVSRKYKAHVDNASAYRSGDVVKMQETRPISKDKRWKVIAVIRKASQNAESPVEEISTESVAEIVPQTQGAEQHI